MNWFSNMFAPINWRTNIADTLEGYNQYCFNVDSYSLRANAYGLGQNADSTFINSIFYPGGGNILPNFNRNLFGFVTDNYNPFGCSSYDIYLGSIGSSYNPFAVEIPEVTKVSSPKQTTKPNSEVKTSTSPVKSNFSKTFRNNLVSNAEKYLNYNEADGSYKKFTKNKEWCADFVTYVVKETYQKLGKTPPKGFGAYRCEDLKQWAIDNNKFLTTANKPDKKEIIKTKVNPGDILIMRENGASHTGIVCSVDRKTGNYSTIEGNVTNRKGIDSVLKLSHNFDDKEVSGFIQLS